MLETKPAESQLAVLQCAYDLVQQCRNTAALQQYRSRVLQRVLLPLLHTANTVCLERFYCTQVLYHISALFN